MFDNPLGGRLYESGEVKSFEGVDYVEYGLERFSRDRDRLELGGTLLHLLPQ